MRPKIAKTAAMLAKLPLRLEIEDVISRNQLDPKGAVAQMSAGVLAEELVKVVVENWPLGPSGLDTMQPMLSPLKEICGILDPDKLNEFVRVRDDPCVMTDRRMPLSDFKKALCQRLFPRPNHCEQ